MKPSLPAVGGSEGVGEVTEVGSEVKELRPGDQVVIRADLCLGNGSTCSLLSIFKLLGDGKDMPQIGCCDSLLAVE